MHERVSLILMILTVGIIITVCIVMGLDFYDSHKDSKSVESAVSDKVGEEVKFDFKSLNGNFILKGDTGVIYSAIYDSDDDTLVKVTDMNKEDYVQLKESDEEKRKASDSFIAPIIIPSR